MFCFLASCCPWTRRAWCSPIINLAKRFTSALVAFGSAAAPRVLSAMLASSSKATMLPSDSVAALGAAGVAAVAVVSAVDALSLALHAPSATHAASTRERSVHRRGASCIRSPDGVVRHGKHPNLLLQRKTRTACLVCRDAHAAITDSGAAVVRLRHVRRRL